MGVSIYPSKQEIVTENLSGPRTVLDTESPTENQMDETFVLMDVTF